MLGKAPEAPETSRLRTIRTKGVDKVYVLDKWTGNLLNEFTRAENFSGAEINSAGDLLYCRWNGVQEELISFDLSTQTGSSIGIVGTLNYWSSQTAIDNDIDVYYVVGSTSVGVDTLWAMDSISGALLASTTLSEGVAAMTLQDNGNLLYLTWNGTQEELKSLDPTTGTASVLGIVGDLNYISNGGELVYNPHTGHSYVFGSDSTQQPKIWVMDTPSGMLVSDTLISETIPEVHLIH